jgi:hypothetical protein
VRATRTTSQTAGRGTRLAHPYQSWAAPVKKTPGGFETPSAVYDRLKRLSDLQTYGPPRRRKCVSSGGSGSDGMTVGGGSSGTLCGERPRQT